MLTQAALRYKSRLKTVVLWNIIMILINYFLLYFFYLISEIILICWFASQETFPIIINVKNSCAP